MAEQSTIEELLSPGKPLERGHVLAGAGKLGNNITWTVSLRPYAPAIPPLKGGEIGLAATEALNRHEPPIKLADVVRYLHDRGASGLAVKGEISADAQEAAESIGLPLIRLPDDASLHDIEQEIMRECALIQARREVMASEEPGAWVGRLLDGQIATLIEAQAPARREGYVLSATYVVALVTACNVKNRDEDQSELGRMEKKLRTLNTAHEASMIPCMLEHGLAVLVPPADVMDLMRAIAGEDFACGIGTEKPLLQASLSLNEARLAATSSARLHEGRPVRYADMGAERLILLIYERDPSELETFAYQTLGPLLRHDAKSATKLLPTVSSFVGHGGRLRETAAEIYVHRNTLAYRLDRAADILGVDLKDADHRLALEIALRALPLVRGEKGDL